MPCRVMIFSPHALRLEKTLSLDAGIHLLATWDKETDVFSAVCQTLPDLILLDEALPGLNVASVLRRLETHISTPPRVLLLSVPDAVGPYDGVYPLTSGTDGLMDAVHAAASRAVPALAESAMPRRLLVAQALAQSLGMPAHFKGTGCLIHAAAMASCHVEMPSAAQLYAYAAVQESTTPAAAERAIRTAAEHTWLKGSLAAISRLFGYTVDPDKGKPTNSELIALLARHIKDQFPYA